MFTVTKTKPETFDFQLEGSKKTYHVPVMSSLPLAQVLRLKELNTDDPDPFDLLAVIRDVFDEFAPGVVDGLTAEQLSILFQAYTEASGVNPGE